jgi:hypothetical protein
VSLNTKTRNFQEDRATIRFDHHRDYNLTHIKVQATINETRSEIETTKREFHSQLEVVEARSEWGIGPGVSASKTQPPIFEGTTF